MHSLACTLKNQGYEPCNCFTYVNGRPVQPCRAGLRIQGGRIQRLVFDAVLSRPEDYLSIYQSGCNHNCLKCHSWYFAQYAKGSWITPEDIVKIVLEYRKQVTVWEPRSRATMWHASDLCAHCGSCVLAGTRGFFCPGKLKPEQVLWSPQGYGPARNIVSFTGGDLYCQPAFYAKAFRLIKREAPDMWIHIETNGHGLTPRNLEVLYETGLDSVWLDMKAYKEDTYRFLCGTSNKRVLELPAELHDMGLVLEVVLLYIPGLVEVDQLSKFAEHIASVDPDIPVMLLAFFPEYKLANYRSPTVDEIVAGYRVLRSKLNHVKIGNVGVFCRTLECVQMLIEKLGREAVGL
ncbi:MAG: radical SAM protein [Desulfurococcaceae archaeon]